ncbi:MAG: hypothetical protein ACP5HU_10005 [Phycisphaerae bacterium]
MFIRTLGVAAGKATRVEGCERCGCEFSYVVRRVGMASGVLGVFGAGRAARRDVESALHKARAMVACPQCGHFQASTIRHKRLRWIMLALAAAFVTAVLWHFLGVLADYDREGAAGIIRIIQTGVVILGGITLALSAVMSVLDDPHRFGFMRALHRQRATIRRPGRAPVDAAAPTQQPVSNVPAGDPGPAGVSTADDDDALRSLLSQPSEPASRQRSGRIVVGCESCGKSYRIQAANRGRKVKCACGAVFRI